MKEGSKNAFTLLPGSSAWFLRPAPLIQAQLRLLLSYLTVMEFSMILNKINYIPSEKGISKEWIFLTDIYIVDLQYCVNIRCIAK